MKRKKILEEILKRKSEAFEIGSALPDKESIDTENYSKLAANAKQITECIKKEINSRR